MALDPTAREANLRDSIKKYCIDTFETAGNIPVTFDIMVDQPPLRDKSITRWVSVTINDMDMGQMSLVEVDFYCVTRKDPEGFRVAQLRDIVYDALIDTTQSDGMRRIPFYRSYSDRAWELIGALVVQSVIESGMMRNKENGKFKILTATLRFASKV